LILGYTAPVNLTVKKVPFSFVVYDLEVAQALNRYQPGCEVHLFVDTGMNREGVPVEELPAFVAKLKKLNNLKIVGLTSHFADADNPTDTSMTRDQLAAYRQAVQICEAQGVRFQWKHLAASGGAYKVSVPDLNVIRAGLASYGWSPLSAADPRTQDIELQPALSFTSTLVQIKSVPAGAKVGYNATYTTTRPTILGLIPAGYYEGVDRRLSNQGLMTIKGQLCPIVGRVSMNMTAIDITGVEHPQVGDKVMVYSREKEAPNSIAAAAQVAGTIPYELLVHLAESVRRTVVD
jgi:alanine racemase